MDVDIGFITVDHVVKRVAFVLVQANVFGIYGDVIGDQCVEGYASTFAQVFSRITRLNGAVGGREILSVRIGQHFVIHEIPLFENGQWVDMVADNIVGRAQGIDADKILSRWTQLIEFQVWHVRHFKRSEPEGFRQQAGVYR